MKIHFLFQNNKGNIDPNREKSGFIRRKSEFWNGPAGAWTWVQVNICGVIRAVSTCPHDLTDLERFWRKEWGGLINIYPEGVWISVQLRETLNWNIFRRIPYLLQYKWGKFSAQNNCYSHDIKDNKHPWGNAKLHLHAHHTQIFQENKVGLTGGWSSMKSLHHQSREHSSFRDQRHVNQAFAVDNMSQNSQIQRASSLKRRSWSSGFLVSILGWWLQRLLL